MQHIPLRRILQPHKPHTQGPAQHAPCKYAKSQQPSSKQCARHLTGQDNLHERTCSAFSAVCTVLVSAPGASTAFLWRTRLALAADPALGACPAAAACCGPPAAPPLLFRCGTCTTKYSACRSVVSCYRCTWQQHSPKWAQADQCPTAAAHCCTPGPLGSLPQETAAAMPKRLTEKQAQPCHSKSHLRLYCIRPCLCKGPII
jgi:hypothetical protein